MKKDSDTTSPEELTDFLVDRFSSNIEIFKKLFPNIGKEFENYIPKRSMDFFCSESGTPNMIFSDDNLSFYEKHSPVQFLSFSTSSLLNNLTNGNRKKDLTDPKEFCRYQAESILNERINIIPPKEQRDDYGQIHYKYFNNMVRYYNEESEKNSAQLSVCKCVPLFVCVGVGLGYLFAEIYKKIDIANLIVIEPNKDVFFASLHTFDWKNFLLKFERDNKSISFILEDDINIIGLGFYRFFLQRGLFHVGANFIHYHCEDELNLKIHKELVLKYIQIPSAFGFFDDRIFGIAHASYSLSRKKNFVIKKDMPKEYQNIPVFIIGSGPSLDKDLPFIRKYQDKALVIACGTAIDVLYHAGIMADFFANTERVPEIFQSLSIIPDKNYFKDIILLCSNVTHPSVVDFFSQTAIFDKKDENFGGYLSANLSLTEIDSVSHMNPMVGNMGLSGAIKLGFKKIYLFGLDNGKKVGQQSIHSIYTTLYKKRGYSEDNDFYKTNKYIEANFGGECETNDLFLNSISMMKISIGLFLEQEGTSCFNCSDGALIDGATPKYSADLVELFNSLDNVDKAKFRKYMLEEKTKSFDVSIEQIKGIIYPQIYKRICDNILDITKNRPSDLKEWIPFIQSICDFLNNIASDLSLFYAKTTESSIYGMLSILTSTLFATDDIEENQKRANHLLDIIEDYLLESPLVFEKLPDYIMGEHSKYYLNGKVGKDMPHCRAPIFPKKMNILRKEYDDPIKIFEKKYV